MNADQLGVEQVRALVSAGPRVLALLPHNRRGAPVPDDALAALSR